MFFNRNQAGGVNWILVGLGNPGSKYESTRHNMGWLALDSLMEKENFKLNKLRFKAWTGILEKNGNKILVMKPQTYMNLSGESVGEAARFYKVPADHVLVNSTKSMVGHLLGAAGGVEAVVCAKSIQDGFVHQTIGTREADAECDLNYCIGAPVETDVKLAMSNSLGFGGHNAVLLFQKYE